MRTRLPASCLATIAAIACVSAPAAAQELFRQNPINSFGGYSAQDARNPNGLGWFSEVVDNFTAADNWSVNSVEFWGGYVTSIPGNTHGFTVRFYENEDSIVGARLYEQDVFTFTETEYYSVDLGPPLGVVRGYHYTVALPAAFAATAGESYWVSVTAILDRGGTANEPQWGWVQAPTVSAPDARQWFFSPGNFNPLGADMSFVLNGTVAAPCDGDVNCDFALDGFDVEVQEKAVGGEMTDYCQPNPDFNGDFALDGFDVEAVEIVVGGGACP